MKIPLFYIVLILLVLLGLSFFASPVLVDKALNRVYGQPRSGVSEQARALHRQLLIADLHCDALLWNRDLLVRGARGHVDIPRLLDGHVALQAFTIVTSVPLGSNIERTADRWDLVTPLAIAQRWPSSTWGSLKERVLYQVEKLKRVAAASGGRFVVIDSAADLERYLQRRRDDPAITAGFIGVEGAQALEGNPENVGVFFDAGVRMMAPTHFFDTEVGGSVHGIRKGGLTPLGREVIERMQSLGMLVDLAHASHRLIDDVLAMTTRPVIVSHTGVKATCDNNRNLGDEHIRGIADTGGVIGIGTWSTAVCGRGDAAIAAAIRHVVDLVGLEHVGLGSDFDGAVAQPFDAAGLIHVTAALMDSGFTDAAIHRIMGENTIRLLRESLP